jgi:hypothetical protein
MASHSRKEVLQPRPALTNLLRVQAPQQRSPLLRQREYLRTVRDKFRGVHAIVDSVSPEPKRSLRFPEMNRRECGWLILATELRLQGFPVFPCLRETG